MNYLKPDHLALLKDIVRNPPTVYERREKSKKGKDIRTQVGHLERFELVTTTPVNGRQTTRATPLGKKLSDTLSAKELGNVDRLRLYKDGNYWQFSACGTITPGSVLAPDPNSTNVGSV